MSAKLGTISGGCELLYNALPKRGEGLLTIRREQMAIFEAVGLKKFEANLFEELQQFAPSHCCAIGPEAVHEGNPGSVSRASRNARVYQARTVGFMYSLCSCSVAGSIPMCNTLGRRRLCGMTQPGKMARAEALHMGMLAYIGGVFGPDKAFARKALRPLRAAALAPAPEDRDALRRELPKFSKGSIQRRAAGSVRRG